MNSDGAFTLGSTGSSVGITGLGFQPNHLSFHAGPRSATVSKVQYYFGSVDMTGYQGALSTFGDTANLETKKFLANDRCIYIREYVSGTGWVTRVHASFVSFDVDGFTLNVISADPNFDIWVEARID